MSFSTGSAANTRQHHASSSPQNFDDAVRHHPVSYKDLKGRGLGFDDDDDDDEFDPVARQASDSHLPDVLRDFQRHALQTSNNPSANANANANANKLSAADRLMAQFGSMSVDEHQAASNSTPTRSIQHHQQQERQPSGFPAEFTGSGALRSGQLPEGAMSLEELEAQLLGTAPGAISGSQQRPLPDLDQSASSSSPLIGTPQAPPQPPMATTAPRPSSLQAWTLPRPQWMPGFRCRRPRRRACRSSSQQQQPQQEQMMMGMPMGMASMMGGIGGAAAGLPAHLLADMSPEDMAMAMVENSEQQLRAIRKARREARMRENARFNGIMSQREKDLTARIQIGQLVTADPMVDDYYFQVLTKTRAAAAKEAADAEAAAAAAGEDADNAGDSSLMSRTSADNNNNNNNNNGNMGVRQDRRRHQQGNNNTQGNRPLLLRKAIREGSLQDQIDRIVDHAKKKTRNTQISLDGALGKISLKTTKNPRQQLNLASPDNPASAPKAKTISPTSAAPATPLLHGRAARRLAHKVTEELFDLVLACEALHLSRPTPDSKRTVIVTEDGDERMLTMEEELGVWEQELMTALDKLWGRLQQFEAGDVHPVVQMLSMSKGKKLWPRLVNMLSTPHVTKVLLDMFGRAQQLDVVRQASIPALFAAPQLFPGLSSSRPSMDALLAFVGDVEDFMHYVLPSLVTFISDAPWPMVASSLEAVLDRNDMVRLGSSKVGLALLTMLVSRAEILSQSNQAPGWPELYLRVFNELQGHYLAFFPVSAMANLPDALSLDKLPSVLVPPVLPPPSQGGPTAADLLDFYLTDDAHVWQFLASLAVAATVEQQTMLVTEVRERILANVVAGQVVGGEGEVTAADKAERAVYNVNLFLHALGLDASQIQTAM
ncbi:topoisomerase II-associated protein PAT1 [Catenaria anguillulae PL171]|uniref:Topoisomerase II-associated protein PAT1 n=1 Tax=Catenaria anguillulae PL171 TaxID=765915 RepID=A0A1Y2H5L3_9FUNG|nr:topoisomerase II-associated protein PAT1 [Catenaria anguillulae PL171]